MRLKFVFIVYFLCCISLNLIAQSQTTYCNPLNIDYTYMIYNANNDISYRSGADPAVVKFRNEYYMFVTRSLGYWHSTDLNNWEFIYPEKWYFQGCNAPAAHNYKDSILYVAGDPSGSMSILYTDNPKKGDWKAVPSILNDPSKPFTPAGGNPQVEGIPNQKNTNPQTPLNPGNVPTNIPAKGYVTVITKVLGFYNGVQASYFEVCVDSTVITDGKEHKTDASPPCATGSGLGSKYTVQAPGNIGIGVKNLRPVSYMVEHPLSMYIDAYESKTFTIYITPYP